MPRREKFRCPTNIYPLFSPDIPADPSLRILTGNGHVVRAGVKLHETFGASRHERHRRTPHVAQSVIGRRTATAVIGHATPAARGTGNPEDARKVHVPTTIVVRLERSTELDVLGICGHTASKRRMISSTES